MSLRVVFVILGYAVIFPLSHRVQAETLSPTDSLFVRDNLVAWCIVPFDATRRGPVERAEMLDRLGFKMLAYDWRDEHIPTFEDEIIALKDRGMRFHAHWCSGHGVTAADKKMFELFQKHDIQPELWITPPSPNAANKQQQLKLTAQALQPLVDKSAELGCRVGLYNHGGWAGEPETLAALARHFRETKDGSHVGIIYNFHHGHEHLDRFPKAFAEMVPFLFCVNLNGMNPQGPKILPMGGGTEDLKILKMIRDSGYRGPIGILDHRGDLDAEQSLRENLDGLKKLLEQMGDTAALNTYKEVEP